MKVVTADDLQERILWEMKRLRVLRKEEKTRVQRESDNWLRLGRERSGSWNSLPYETRMGIEKREKEERK